MSETISLDWIGAQLRTIQAEQRTLRGENELLRKQIARMATREELSEALGVLVDRVANFEALAEARIDHLATAMAAGFERIGAQLDRIERRP